MFDSAVLCVVIQNVNNYPTLAISAQALISFMHKPLFNFNTRPFFSSWNNHL